MSGLDIMDDPKYKFLKYIDDFSFTWTVQFQEDDSDEEEESQASRPGSVTSGHVREHVKKNKVVILAEDGHVR